MRPRSARVAFDKQGSLSGASLFKEVHPDMVLASTITQPLGSAGSTNLKENVYSKQPKGRTVAWLVLASQTEVVKSAVWVFRESPGAAETLSSDLFSGSRRN
jgi:hypothetical protein